MEPIAPKQLLNWDNHPQTGISIYIILVQLNPYYATNHSSYSNLLWKTYVAFPALASGWIDTCLEYTTTLHNKCGMEPFGLARSP